MTSGKKKTYLALLGGSILIMAVDRLILGGSSPIDVPASAIAQLVRTAAPDGTTPVTVQAVIPSIQFPRNLPQANLDAGFRDIFAPPPVAEPPVEADKPPASANSSDLSKADFAAQHRLQAVLWSDGLRIAVINGEWRRVGDEFGGCRLMDIKEKRVRISCFDGETELTFASPVGRIAH